MNTQTPIQRRKWRKRRNQNLGSVILALGHIKDQFYQKLVRVEKSYEKLQACKKKLLDGIAEVEMREEMVRNNKNSYQSSITQLEEEVHDAENAYLNSPAGAGSQVDAIMHQKNWACIDIANGRKQIREVDLELQLRSSIVLTRNNLGNHSSSKPDTGVTIQLSDIDSLGTMEKVGSIKMDYFTKCCICLEKDIDCVLYRCAHNCCCSTCAVDLQKKVNGRCPVCHSRIEKVIKTYYV